MEVLRPLVGIIPAHLSAELSPLLSESTSPSSSTPTIPYALLLSISRWARTEEAARALRSKIPALDPLEYNMVSLLAGTRTSPDKKFPQLSHSSENPARDISDRRAIIAVLNALLSVICTGAATWWAAQRTGWRDEWKVLLSLLAATIVAVSEIGLYIIWESRHRPTKAKDNRARPPGDPVSRADTHDIGADNSFNTTRLDNGSSQAGSIELYQSSARIALRQRVGTRSKSHSG